MVWYFETVAGEILRIAAMVERGTFSAVMTASR